MRFNLALAIAGLTALSSAYHVKHKRQSAVDTFVTNEEPIAFSYALGNIGGTAGNRVPGADPGIVVASPANGFPTNYFYTWTRDSALTYAMIVDEYIFGNDTLNQTIWDYVAAQAELQTVTNPSGSLWPAGDGLGEIKFFSNKTRFDKTWGRPQRDGPALRATVFIMLGEYYLANGNQSIVEEIFWPLIMNDLKYVGQYWNQTGYELWEEVHGTSFFTLNAQHRALTQGNYLAEKLGQTCVPCEQAPEIACLLGAFWNETGSYITADVNRNQITDRSGINVSPLISSIQVFDIEATCDAIDYQPCNSKILATHKTVVDVFRTLYPINNNATAPNAVAVGRYPEDTYFGGNPWYLCTLACAEVLYAASAQFNRSGHLTVDEYSLAFFQDIYPNASETTYRGSSMAPILEAMRTYADGFVSVVETYIEANGSMAEQFNKTTGEGVSAYDLTWSLASFVTMARRRDGYYPPSWGAMDAEDPPENCSATSFDSTYTYMPARAAGAPGVDMSCKSNVEFNAYIVNNDSNPFLLGNTSLLGGSVNNPQGLTLPLDPGRLNSTNNNWFMNIWLPAGITIEYQYVMETPNGTLFFQNDTQIVQVPRCEGEKVYTYDTPFFPGGTNNATSEPTTGESTNTTATRRFRRL